MEDKNFIEKYLGKDVSVVRSGANPIHGRLSEAGKDGIVVTAQRQEIGVGGLATGRMLDDPVFVPWGAVQGVAYL